METKEENIDFETDTAWAEINLAHLEDNIRIIESYIPETTTIGAVVKADAYGLGAETIVGKLREDARIQMFIVGKPAEAEQIEAAAGDKKILILDQLTVHQVLTARNRKREKQTIYSIYSMEFLRELDTFCRTQNCRIQVHIRIDLWGSGMGISSEDFMRHQEEIFAFSAVEIQGVYTHLYSAYQFDEKQTEAQLQQFDQIIAQIPKELRRKLIVHAQNSPLIFTHTSHVYDMVRSGTAIYGLLCHPTETFGLLPLLSVKARISMIADIKQDCPISYQKSEKKNQNIKLAWILFGYWDCPFLMTQQHIKVSVRGHLYEIAEEPCMDQAGIMLPEDAKVQVGDVAVLLGEEKGVTLGELLKRHQIALVHSEWLCLLSKRLHKKYLYTAGRESMKDQLLNQVRKEAPLLNQCLSEYGDWTLASYCRKIAKELKESNLAMQKMDVLAESQESPEEVAEAVREYLQPLVKDALAKKTSLQILEQRFLLTANHHEAEFCVQAFQGNLLYEFVLSEMGYRDGIVPIFSNTTVNMSNSNFPRGLLLYHAADGMQKVPIFPFRERNSMVACANAFTKEMAEQAQAVVHRQLQNGSISVKTEEAVQRILSEVFLDDEVLKCNRYGEQALLINQKLGKWIYTDKNTEFLYIELEQITIRLLEKDLKKCDSVVSRLLFQPMERELITEKLNGKTGCWDVEHQRGTWMFWGVDRRKRRYPLWPLYAEGKLFLSGIDMDGTKNSYCLTTESLLELLAEGKLIPCLFLSFLELHFLRGFAVAGGCFQSLYLNDMWEGLCAVLAAEGRDMKTVVRPQSFYLSGPMFLYQTKNHTAYPVGMAELIEEQGISYESCRKKMEISMRQAHELGLYNFYIDLIPKKEQQEGWWQHLSQELGGIWDDK